MELNSRVEDDRFVSAGSYRALEAGLRRRSDLAEVRAVVLSAFDRSTRLLPFVLYDRFMFPAGARSIAGALLQAGFLRTRAVFELWNPRFRPSRARLDGRPPEMLLVSSMQLHAARAYAAIKDAYDLGERRPLIIAGGPKAVYEPCHFWSIPGKSRFAPDVAVTGESYVLLHLLEAIAQHRGPRETMREGFERARREGALESVPGLMYLSPEASLEEPLVVDTGLQRLVKHFDELPHEAAGLSVMEPPHHGEGLSVQAIPDSRVRKRCSIVSLMLTQGCKFNCSYCPIPALNQKSWRFRSPEGVVEEIRSVHERFGVKYFFGTDDNFFNHRPTAEAILSALAAARTERHRLGDRIRWATEATQFDTYKNRDLLPVARAAGLHSIWFGIEDLTAQLIKKGQRPETTIDLFRLMHERKISPMAMIMFHEGQPFYSRDSLYGLYNQVKFLREAGAVSLQCTVHVPAVGTREYEQTYGTGRVIQQIGRYRIPESKIDGNHVLLAGRVPPWRRQLELLAGYAAFYNPWNIVRALKKGSRLRRRRFGYQVAGTIATIWTAWKYLPYVLRLLTSRIHCHRETPPLETVPVRTPAGGFSRHPKRAPDGVKHQPDKVRSEPAVVS